ncbi:MAG: UDP-N-acetylmuramoylalanyl-D-glutamyl-2,6-diaminopimelate--D-alanyl-D-alanine ligase, partial [Rhodospirillales bacterium]|nr:UDP-N-acetylmuramoylalanyl-D-glutamyl-2,6-diaminopimelate--D-alanyl-D-alanine ligase [Rhodospirillales bacterium]
MMPELWSSEEAALACGGIATSDWSASGVSIDTRTLNKGDLFVALHGPNFDGHEFVSEALAKGAAAALVDSDVEGAALLKVDDTMAALEALGRASRARSQASIIAVTGSVGKTGSKEALKYVLSAQGETNASVGSLNNHWGVPLSLSRLSRSAAFGIFEIGMNHPGEINPLSRMVRPHVALITTVEAVHSEFFDSDEAIADAKAEIFAGLEPGGAVVLNRDNRHFLRLVAAARAKGIDRIIGFGTWDEADFRLLDALPDNGGTVIRADLGGQQLTYRLAMPGHHWVVNSLGILASVAAAGGNVVDAAKGFSELEAPAGRGRFHLIHTAGGEITLIDESYNASPVSMKAAIEVLGQTTPAGKGRRIAVLGDMLELGHTAPQLHAALVDVLQREGIDLVFTAGPDMGHLSDALAPAMRGGHTGNTEQLQPMVVEAVQAGDVVVV